MAALQAGHQKTPDAVPVYAAERHETDWFVILGHTSKLRTNRELNQVGKESSRVGAVVTPLRRVVAVSPSACWPEPRIPRRPSRSPWPRRAPRPGRAARLLPRACKCSTRLGFGGSDFFAIPAVSALLAATVILMRTTSIDPARASHCAGLSDSIGLSNSLKNVADVSRIGTRA